MYPNRKVNTNVVIQLDEHATQETLNESLSLIYHAYLIQTDLQNISGLY